MNRINRALFIFAIIIVVAGNVRRIYFSGRVVPTEKQLLEVITNSHIAGKGEKGPFHYKGFVTEKREKITGVAYTTTTIQPIVKGFVDEINVLIGMDTQGKITGVKVLDHHETPSYMNTILKSNFLEDFVGLNVTNGPFPVDTITSATISSQAIHDDVYASSVEIARSVLEIPVPVSDEKKVSVLDTFLEPESMIFFSLLLFALTSFLLKKNKIMRDISLIISLIGLGFYYNTFLYLGNITHLLSLQFPAVSNPNLFLLLLFTLITTPLFGVVFCSHLCPFGAMQEFLYRFFSKRWHVSSELRKQTSNVRYFLLFWCILMVCGLQMDSFAQVEPFPYFFSWVKGTAIGSMWIYVVGTLLVSAFFNRFYCRVFCPTGVCLSLLARGRKGNFKGYS